MVEVRHGLNVRRQKLREQMEYNMKRIEEAKANVTDYIKNNPKYANEIMQIVDSYDMGDV
jgi:DNA topoisomerase IA